MRECVAICLQYTLSKTNDRVHSVGVFYAPSVEQKIYIVGENGLKANCHPHFLCIMHTLCNRQMGIDGFFW